VSDSCPFVSIIGGTQKTQRSGSSGRGGSTVCHCFFVAAILALITTQLRADAVLPTGLAPGSQYEIAFVTADTITATSADISYYNNFVRTEAEQSSTLASLGVSWNAIASTDSVNANANAPFNSSIPVYNTQGQLLADAANPLYGSPYALLAPMYTQTGNSSATQVWTGSDPTGVELSANLISNGQVILIYAGLGDGEPEVGDTHYYNYWNWISSSDASASQSLPLYALSSPIPEPSTLVLFGIGAVSLLTYAWRWRAKAS
jgi:hypothetical protein